MRQRLSACDYHEDSNQPAYQGHLDEVVVKQHAGMAVVDYQACHQNEAESAELAGLGLTRSTWVFSEDGDKAEGLSQCGLNLFIDSELAPHASIGMHLHADKEEIYYLLSGSLTITVERHDGQREQHHLVAGDAHLVRLGQRHAAVAGEQGARMIAVCVSR